MKNYLRFFVLSLVVCTTPISDLQPATTGTSSAFNALCSAFDCFVTFFTPSPSPEDIPASEVVVIFEGRVTSLLEHLDAIRATFARFSESEDTNKALEELKEAHKKRVAEDRATNRDASAITVQAILSTLAQAAAGSSNEELEPILRASVYQKMMLQGYNLSHITLVLDLSYR